MPVASATSESRRGYLSCTMNGVWPSKPTSSRSNAGTRGSDALKNASLPIITLIGIEFAFLIGGLVVTETVFNLPGVARYLVDAIQFRDYPVVQNLVMFIAIVVVLANLTVDLLYAWVDPRIKYGRA